MRSHVRAKPKIHRQRIFHRAYCVYCGRSCGRRQRARGYAVCLWCAMEEQL